MQHFVRFCIYIVKYTSCNMKNPFKSSGKIGFLSMILALLGLGGCEAAEDIGDIKCMYGSPTVHYSVKGKVTDEKGKPVQGIEVTIEGQYQEEGVVINRPITQPRQSGADGTWSAEEGHLPYSTLLIRFKDIDGEANGGLFAEDSTTVAVNVVKDPKETNPWRVGDANISVPTIKLKKQ